MGLAQSDPAVSFPASPCRAPSLTLAGPTPLAMGWLPRLSPSHASTQALLARSFPLGQAWSRSLQVWARAKPVPEHLCCHCPGGKGAQG